MNLMANLNHEQLQDEVNKLNLGIPSGVFHFEFNRPEAKTYLLENPSIPFIMRQSSIDGYFAIDSFGVTGNFSHILLAPPNEEHSEFKLYHYENNVPSELKTPLRDYLEDILKRHQKKQHLLDRVEQKFAVLSIQSLDGNESDEGKVALSPEQVKEYALRKPKLQFRGNGHTGFAMAKALHAPFVVMRSKENREEANRVLKDHIGNNGLIVVTGHGSPAGNNISGHYISPLEEQETRLFNEQTSRGPFDVVSSLMDAGLKRGDHVTVLLSICFGAKESEPGAADSFAHKLAREMAKNGISSTILASDEPVHRFGFGEMVDDALTFNNNVGMDANNVHVFDTELVAPTENPVITIFKPNQTIKLSDKGMHFVPSTKHQTADSPKIAPLIFQPEISNLPDPMVQPKNVFQENQVQEEQRRQQEEQRRQQKIHELKTKAQLLQDKENQTKQPEKGFELTPEETRAFDKIDGALNTLRHKIGTRDKHLDEKAYLQSISLLELLTKARNKYLVDLNNPNLTIEHAGRVFKDRCKKHINKAKPILERDLSWGDYLENLLISLFNAVIKALTFGHTKNFFTQVKSKSFHDVEQAEMDLGIGQGNSLE